jgi:nitroreductase
MGGAAGCRQGRLEFVGMASTSPSPDHSWSPLAPPAQGASSESVPRELAQQRQPTFDIAPWILARWSPRAMTGEPISEAELMPLFEAARWAPSSFNAQPWRFLVARRDSPHWKTFLGLLVPGNREWAQRAAALVVVVSRTKFERNEKPSRTHAYDAGAAWENLALEASRRGLATRGMEGFDYERARTALHVPPEFEVLAMIAIGRRGNAEVLPERLRAMEAPNDRRPLHEIVLEGGFPAT